MEDPTTAVAPTKNLVTQDEGEKWYAKLASSYLIFLIVTAIVLAFVTAIFATNTVFYDKINKNKGCNGAVTESEANTLYWLNLVLAVISGIFFFTAVVLAFLQYEKPKWTDKYIGRVSYTPGTSVEAARQRVAPLALRARAGAERVQAGAARLPARLRAGYAGFQRPELQEALGQPGLRGRGAYAVGDIPPRRGTGIDPRVLAGMNPNELAALRAAGHDV